MNLRTRKGQEAFSPPAGGIWALPSVPDGKFDAWGHALGDRSQQVPLQKVDGGPREDRLRPLN